MSKAYFAPLVTLPVIIDATGIYRTRCGDEVAIDNVSAGHDFECRGRYRSGKREGWHRSGRLYAGVQCRNDVVAKA